MDETYLEDGDVVEQDDVIEQDDQEQESDTTEETISLSKKEYDELQERLKKSENIIGFKKRQEKKIVDKSDNSDAVLSRLEARGYMEKDEQDFILNLSKKTGLHPIDLLQDSDTSELVKTKIDAMRKRKDTNAAMPTSKGRPISEKKDELSKWVDKYNETGEMPDPFKESELFDKLEERLGLTRKRRQRFTN